MAENEIKEAEGEISFREKAIGTAVIIVLNLIVVGVLMALLAASPLLVAAFPLSITALVLVMGFGWIRHRRRKRKGASS